MTYYVKPYPPDQAWTRDAILMAIKYKNDDVVLEPAIYSFQTPLPVHSGQVFSHIVFGGRKHEAQRTILHFPTATDGRLLLANADRISYIHDIKIIGANTQQTPEEPSNNEADYLAPNISKNLIGLAIDYDTRIGSGGTVLERVFVERCAVGFGIGCSGESLNASGTKLINCGAAYCDILMSSGHSQQRATRVENFVGAYARLAFSGLDHGRRQGVPPIINGFEGSFIHTLGRYSSRFGQTLSWDNMWAEYIKGIVHWMGTPGAAASIRNSTFVINMVKPINAFYGENNQREEKMESVCEAHSTFTFDSCNIVRNPRGTIRFTEGRAGLFNFINMPDFPKEFVLG